MRVLVVEDEPALALRLQKALEGAGFVTDVAYDGEEAWFLGGTESFDAVVLDLGLSRLDGLSVLQRWRAEGRTMPVLILTARSRWSEKAAGFNAGADDYVTKPFEMDEVVMRIKALIRRAAGHVKPELECGGLRLDTNSGRATMDGEPLALTAQEWRILSYLMHHQGRLVGRSELMEHVYDRNQENDSNVIDVLISRIRRKLARERPGHELLHTVRGQGWRLEADDEAP